MPVVNAHEANTQLSRLLAQVEAGDEVVMPAGANELAGASDNDPSGGSGVGDDRRRWLATLIADAFWRLFNRPAVISLLRQLAAGTAAVGDESAYWRLVLHYCRQGNLQAVLDEQWRLLWEQDSWSEDASAEGSHSAVCPTRLDPIAACLEPIDESVWVVGHLVQATVLEEGDIQRTRTSLAIQRLLWIELDVREPIERNERVTDLGVSFSQLSHGCDVEPVIKRRLRGEAPITASEPEAG